MAHCFQVDNALGYLNWLMGLDDFALRLLGKRGSFLVLSDPLIGQISSRILFTNNNYALARLLEAPFPEDCFFLRFLVARTNHVLIRSNEV